MNKIPVTVLLIVVNVLVFAGVALHQGNIMLNRPEDFLLLLHSVALFNPFVIEGEYWRLFSSMFMHWGIIHLAVNMYALYSIGRELEAFMGKVRFALLYFATGIAGGLSSLFFNLYAISVGASGAIFGLYGFMITWQVFVNFRNKKLLGSILINFIIFIVINYAIAQSANVDTPAHLGGFVMGALLSILNFLGLLIPVFQWAILVVVLPFLILAVPKYQLKYYNIFQTVVNADDNIQRIYSQMLTDEQRGDSLSLVKPQWDSATNQLKELGIIPDKLGSDTAILSHYIAYRAAEVDYRLRGVEYETFIYLDSIEIVNEKLNALPRLQYILNYRLSNKSNDQSLDEEREPPGEWITQYYDSSWREIPSEYNAQYYRSGMRDTLGRWQGDVRDYFIDGNIQMKGKYLNNMHHGVFRYYTRESKYQSLGRYDNERAVGKWENFYENGQMQSEIYYGDRSFTKSIWDSLGNQQVVGGNGKQITTDGDGNVLEEGEYKEGLKQGNWLGYYSSGKPHYQEFYRDGLLVRGVAMDEEGKRYIYDQLSVFPFPEMGMDAYKKYLERNLIRPLEERNVSGTVKLNFLVDTDGSMRDFVITESLCVPCDKEAIRLVKEGPPWRPGLLRGHIKILSNGYVEVLF